MVLSTTNQKCIDSESLYKGESNCVPLFMQLDTKGEMSELQRMEDHPVRISRWYTELGQGHSQ